MLATFVAGEGCGFACEYLRDRVFDHFLVRHIALVANQELVDALGRIPVNLLQPLLYVVE